MNEKKLTEQNFWDDYWSKVTLPIETKKTNKNLRLNEILTIFEEYLPKDENLPILEIGGAPGQFLVFMRKNFGYNITCLDYLKTGCDKTRENFEQKYNLKIIYKSYVGGFEPWNFNRYENKSPLNLIIYFCNYSGINQ